MVELVSKTNRGQGAELTEKALVPSRPQHDKSRLRMSQLLSYYPLTRKFQ